MIHSVCKQQNTRYVRIALFDSLVSLKLIKMNYKRDLKTELIYDLCTECHVHWLLQGKWRRY